MSVIPLTPQRFFMQASLLLIRAVERSTPGVSKNVARNRAMKEFIHLNKLGGNLLKIVKHETEYFIVEREADGVSIVPKGGGSPLCITSGNRHLMNEWIKHGQKPKSMVEWRQTFGSNAK